MKATYDLQEALSKLDGEVRGRLAAHGFDEARLMRLAATLADSDGEARRDARNRVVAARAPQAGEILAMPEEASDAGAADASDTLRAGEGVLAAGELAFCVMAGGMATRMGGVVKALLPAVDGMSFLDIRLMENARASARAGRPVPMWLMTSDATEGPIREALAATGAPAHVRTFVQDLSVRVTEDGALFVDSAGHVSTYATGHGDLPDALRRSGLLGEFVRAGGKYVWITNVDNLGATLDAALLGLFVATGKELLVEVCDKLAGDRGGIPVHAATGAGGERLQVLEEFRLPKGFDASQVRVFNTNTFLVRADVLDRSRIDWTFFEVQKKVDGKTAVQFERLLQELTAHFDTAYVRVPRDGPRARFLPVKDPEELERRRPEIRAVMTSRLG